MHVPVSAHMHISWRINVCVYAYVTNVQSMSIGGGGSLELLKLANNLLLLLFAVCLY